MNLLTDVQGGSVKLVACDHYADFRIWAEADALRASPFLRLVEIPQTATPLVEAAIAQSVGRLAEAAQALWPEWHTTGARSDATAECDPVPPEPATWLRQAAQLCTAGRLPLLTGLNPAVQAERLAGALDPSRLVLLVPLDSSTVTAPQLAGYVSVVEWLASATHGRVLAVVPSHLAAHPAFDRIRYAGLEWPPPRRDEDEPVGPHAAGYPVFPVIGKPHPLSPGELLLAEAVGADPKLGPLFRYNQPVTGAKGRRFVVDLYWPEGGIVVEVDSYRFHGDRSAFANDRQRDFELLLSGCRVLRLPHDEVIADVAGAVRKIRDLVRYRRSIVRESTDIGGGRET